MCRIVLVGVVVITSGCTTSQLRRNTVAKAETLTDIYQQQVLDNLARFVYDPNALPHFAIPAQGTSAVNDVLEADGTVEWNFTRFLGAGLGAHGGRALSENWVLNPVTDPRRLELMRCAYQRAVANSLCKVAESRDVSTGVVCESSHACPCGFCQDGICTIAGCPDCEKRFRYFYTGEVHSQITGANGIVTINCLRPGECWFGAGGKRDVPKDCGCVLVGRYCDQYVWVRPGQYNRLAQLTLVILDFAVNSPPTSIKKEVTYYVDELGRPTQEGSHVGEVVASLDIDELNETLLLNGLVAEIDGIEREVAAMEANGSAAALPEQIALLKARAELLTQRRDEVLRAFGLLKAQEEIEGAEKVRGLEAPIRGAEGIQNRYRSPGAGGADLGLQGLELRLRAASPE